MMVKNSRHFEDDTKRPHIRALEIAENDRDHTNIIPVRGHILSDSEKKGLDNWQFECG